MKLPHGSSLPQNNRHPLWRHVGQNAPRVRDQYYQQPTASFPVGCLSIQVEMFPDADTLRKIRRVRSREPLFTALLVITTTRQLAMDSFPQELIDEIIDNVPDFSLPSCSLVARRWRRQSQQRALNSIEFSSEDEVYSWWTDIPQGTGGVVSYVRSVHFVEIYSWDEPALFGRVLKNFTSLRELIIARTEIPDELPGHISGGEFRNGITNLCLWFPRCTLATIVSMILLPPNLKELAVDNKRAVLDDDEPLPTHSVMSRRKQLDLLELGGDANGIGEVLAEYRFIASRLHLQLCVPETAQLLTLSSEVVVELHLCGVWFFRIPRLSKN